MAGKWTFSENNWKWNNDENPMGKPITNFPLAGNKLSNTVEVCPGTIYWANIKIANFQGSGQVGLSWTGAGRKPVPETVQPKDFSPSSPELSIRYVAPAEARYATLWMYTTAGSTVTIQSAWFGPQTAGELSVDFNTLLRSVAEPLTSKTVGVNVNYLTDNKGRREGNSKNPPFTNVLKEMKVGSLRYPGGEKADTFLFAPPPNFAGKSEPTLSRQSPNDWPSNDANFYDLARKTWNVAPMTFDEFMEICNTPGINADPYLVFAWDGINKPKVEPGYIETTADVLKKHAVQWAAYCKQNYPAVTRCEFGNECYLATGGAGSTAQDYANYLQWIAPDVKAANPSMKIGANGPNNLTDIGKFDDANNSKTPWWPTVLQQCASFIDFLAIHPYVIWAWNYDDYAAGAVNLVYPIQEANAAIDKYAGGRPMNISITEVAPIDYGLKWTKSPANLGHALVTIDQMASTLMQPRVDCAIFWNTRWITSDTTDPQTYDNSVVNTLYNNSNTLTACGAAVSFVGAFFRDGWPLFSTSSSTVKVFALKTMDGLRLVLLNKSGAPVKQTVNIAGFRSSARPQPANKEMYVFTGSSISDPAPKFVTPNPPATWMVKFGSGGAGEDQLFIDLPPYSATALNLLPDMGPGDAAATA